MRRRTLTIIFGRWIPAFRIECSVRVVTREELAREGTCRELDAQMDALLDDAAAELARKGRDVGITRKRGIA